MLKLFAVVLGGRAERCNIELHDVVFVINESIQQAYPDLVNKWFGIKKGLHLDAYIELTHVDGHDIVISKEKPKTEKKLFYVNFGAYKKDYFGEVHESTFYIGNSKSEVLLRAKKELCQNAILSHCDDKIAVDDVLEINTVDQYYLNFISAEKKALNIITDYRPLDLQAILDQAIA